MPRELPILHYASMGQVGGVERQLAGFLAHRSERFRPRHGVELFEREHPLFRRALRRHASVYYPKHVGPFKVPRPWREGRHGRIARRHAGGVALIWNLLGDLRAVERAHAGGLPAVYFERGLGWFDDQGGDKIRAFLGAIDGAIANSHAGRRVLQLGWGYGGTVEVCRNGLRGDLEPAREEPKHLPTDRPLRLGTCGRLEPFKGVGLALHALAELRKGGLDATLAIAGEGALADELDALAQRLGIADAVERVGGLERVEPFLEEIDVLLHPALREPCANVVPEAMSRGTPVIGSLVDGMGELVQHGETGICIPPTLPLSDYAGLGAGAGRMPIWVYDPLQDRLRDPALVDPARLAEAVRSLAESPERYHAMSAASLVAVRTGFDPQERLEDLLAILHRFARRSPATAAVS